MYSGSKLKEKEEKQNRKQKNKYLDKMSYKPKKSPHHVGTKNSCKELGFWTKIVVIFAAIECLSKAYEPQLFLQQLNKHPIFNSIHPIKIQKF